jgi:hypothetical protein
MQPIKPLQLISNQPSLTTTTINPNNPTWTTHIKTYTKQYIQYIQNYKREMELSGSSLHTHTQPKYRERRESKRRKEREERKKRAREKKKEEEEEEGEGFGPRGEEEREI